MRFLFLRIFLPVHSTDRSIIELQCLRRDSGQLSGDDCFARLAADGFHLATAFLGSPAVSSKCRAAFHAPAARFFGSNRNRLSPQARSEVPSSSVDRLRTSLSLRRVSNSLLKRSAAKSAILAAARSPFPATVLRLDSASRSRPRRSCDSAGPGSSGRRDKTVSLGLVQLDRLFAAFAVLLAGLELCRVDLELSRSDVPPDHKLWRPRRRREWRILFLPRRAAPAASISVLDLRLVFTHFPLCALVCLRLYGHKSATRRE